jgi:hypothetical protein
MVEQGKRQEADSEYKILLENLRSRLNVLNTSIFLLEENIPDSNAVSNKYIKKINSEIKRIREMIIDFPEGGPEKD